MASQSTEEISTTEQVGGGSVPVVESSVEQKIEPYIFCSTSDEHFPDLNTMIKHLADVCNVYPCPCEDSHYLFVHSALTKMHIVCKFECRTRGVNSSVTHQVSLCCDDVRIFCRMVGPMWQSLYTRASIRINGVLMDHDDVLKMGEYEKLVIVSAEKESTEALAVWYSFLDVSSKTVPSREDVPIVPCAGHSLLSVSSKTVPSREDVPIVPCAGHSLLSVSSKTVPEPLEERKESAPTVPSVADCLSHSSAFHSYPLRDYTFNHLRSAFHCLPYTCQGCGWNLTHVLNIDQYPSVKASCAPTGRFEFECRLDVKVTDRKGVLRSHPTILCSGKAAPMFHALKEIPLDQFVYIKRDDVIIHPADLEKISCEE